MDTSIIWKIALVLVGIFMGFCLLEAFGQYLQNTFNTIFAPEVWDEDENS